MSHSMTQTTLRQS